MRTLHLLALALPIVALSACNGEVESVDPNDNPDADRNGTVEGRVDDQGRRAAVQGAIVSAFQVQSDGSLIRIDDEDVEVMTDADGSYSIDIAFDDDVDVMSNVVIRAESDTFGQAHTLVTSEVMVDSTVTASAMDTESSLEAEIFIEAHVDGDWDDSRMNQGLLRTMVGARTASTVDVVSDLDSMSSDELDIMTDAVVSSMISFDTVLRGDAMSDDSRDADLGAFWDVMTDLQVEFDESSNAASTSAGLNTAAMVQLDGMIDALMVQGFSSGDIALATHAASETSALFAADLDASTAGVLMGEMSEVRTLVAVDAMTDAFAELDLSSETEDKGDTLLDDLQTTLDTSSSLMIDVESLLGDFGDDFETELLSDLEGSLGTTASIAIGTMLDGIRDDGEELSASLDTVSTTTVALTGEDVGDTMSDFALDVQSDTNVTVLTANGFDNGEADAMLDILTQVNAFASYTD